MNIENIKKKLKLKFTENIMSKNELKFLFIYTYDDKRVKDIGLPMHNKNNNICYFITGFNLIARLQYIIYSEINNLDDNITNLVDKINKNECLNDSESKKYNKYLLIQTIIEVHSNEIINKIIPVPISIEEKIQIFIESRLSEFTFPESTLNKNIDELFIDYLIKKCGEISIKCNNYFNNKYNKYLSINYINKIVEDKKVLEGSYKNLKSFSNIHKIFDTIKTRIEGKHYDFKDNYKLLFTQINMYISEYFNILINNFGKYFCKIKIDDNNIILKFINNNEDIKNVYTNFYDKLTKKDIEELEKDFTEIYNEMKELLKLNYKRIYDILKIEDLPINPSREVCTNDKLKKIYENIKFMRENLAVNASKNGSESSVVVNSLINILDTDKIDTDNVSLNTKYQEIDMSSEQSPNETYIIDYDKPYYIQNITIESKLQKGNIFDSLKDKFFAETKNKKKYRLCGISFVCPGHSVASICYNTNCDKTDKTYPTHIVINEISKFENQLNNSENLYNFGKLCNNGSYYIDKLLYESVEYSQTLKNLMNEFISSNNLKIKSFQTGGNIINYYDKYMKYKQKYINLKLYKYKN